MEECSVMRTEVANYVHNFNRSRQWGNQNQNWSNPDQHQNWMYQGKNQNRQNVDWQREPQRLAQNTYWRGPVTRGFWLLQLSSN